MSNKMGETQLMEELEESCKLPRSNNNEDDFININSRDSSTPESGRDSRNSAFSSESEETSGDSSTGSSSGRSSTNLQDVGTGETSADAIHLFKTKSNLVPESPEVTKLVDTVRLRFLDWCGTTQSASENFDPLDLDEIAKALPKSNQFQQSVTFRWITRYFNLQMLEGRDATEEEVDGVLENLKEFLRFRNQYQLSRTVVEDFAREFYILSGIFSFGMDKQGIPILYLRARVHRRWSVRLDDFFRRYVAWNIDQLTKSHPQSIASNNAGKSPQSKDGSFVICFDCLNVSYACLDMDFLRFLVRILVDYYPSYCRYALVVDLPWLFRSVWKLVKSWLPEESQNMVHMITSKQLVDFIDTDQIPNSQKINDLKAHQKPIAGKHALPSNLASIAGLEERAVELNIGKSELKVIKSHLEKVRKEYEQLGAM